MKDFSEDLVFDKIYGTMIRAMWLNRTHPDIPRDKTWACQFLAMHGSFFLICCLLINAAFYEIEKKDFTEACANGILITIFGVVTLKYCVMLRHQSMLKGLMDEMKVDYETAKSFSRNEQRVVYNYANRGKMVVRLWIIIAGVCGGVFLVKSIVLMTYHSVNGNFQLVPAFDLTYPSPVEEMKMEPIVFIALYVMLLLYDVYSIVMYIAVAALGPIFMLHGCGQLELAQMRLMNIFKKDNSEITIMKEIREIVIHLQKVYSFLDRLQECFKVLYELTLKASAFILPISFYQVIQSYHNGDLRIEFITMIIGGIAISSIPCYYSDQLMDMGENVRLAVYMCGWEGHLDKLKSLRTMLLFIHLRASRPVAIHTLFRTVSLDALTDVYHQAYAIFSVLNAASN